jgi:hypothetical protein
MKVVSFLVLLASIASAQASVNGHCVAGGGVAAGVGVCLHIKDCNAQHGTIHNNLCPFDPDDVKCCTNRPAPKCSNVLGICRFTDICNTKSGENIIATGRHQSPRILTYSPANLVQVYVPVPTILSAAFQPFRLSATRRRMNEAVYLLKGNDLWHASRN